MNADGLAALHARCFTVPPAWSARAFADTLAVPGTFLLSDPFGFAVIRVAVGDAELLTLAVAPEARRRGVARGLCQRVVDAARAAGAGTIFLEVAADNHPAHALYGACGWAEVGRRPRYYGPLLAAVVMRLDLAAVTERRTDSD